MNDRPLKDVNDRILNRERERLQKLARETSASIAEIKAEQFRRALEKPLEGLD